MGIVKRKICLLGAFAVGKTSLVQRFVDNRFSDKYLTTVGVSVSQKLMPPICSGPLDRTIQHAFLIWDIAGLEKFDSVAMNYFRGASGALAVGDVTRGDTAAALKFICDKFFSVNPNAALVTIGNKIDLSSNSGNDVPDLSRLASDYGSELILTSAKTGQRVADAFQLLSRVIASSHA